MLGWSTHSFFIHKALPIYTGAVTSRGTDGQVHGPSLWQHEHLLEDYPILGSQQTQRVSGCRVSHHGPEASQGGQVYTQHKCTMHAPYPGSNMPFCCGCFLSGVGCFSSRTRHMLCGSVLIPSCSLVTAMDGSSWGPATPCSLTSPPPPRALSHTINSLLRSWAGGSSPLF